MAQARRRTVRLHQGPRQAIVPAVQFLARWFHLDGVVLGGGTSLEARWHHRRSTDIDLFAPVPFLSALMKGPPDDVEREFRRLVAESGHGDVAAFNPAQLQWMAGDVPVSLSGTDGIWPHDHDPCAEENTGMPLAASADVLLRKMQGRVLAQGRAVARDAYDFVVARAVDPVAFRDAIAQLDEHQSAALADVFELRADAPPPAEGRGVDAPAYPLILERGLWRLAAGVLRDPTRNIDITA